jgi:hypothetical protein
MFGVSMLTNKFWVNRGAWNRITVAAALNSVGAADGLISLDVNGASDTVQQVQIRSNPKLGFTGIFFSTFFGGSDPSWAPSRDQQLGFRDFRLETW